MCSGSPPQLCGVSAKSVSRVINGEPGVSEATADRVLATMEQLGFQRNDLARSLRQGARTGTIGLALEDPAALFYRHVFRGVEAAAREHDSLVLTASSVDADHERDTVLTLCARRVDGLLVVPAGGDYSYLRVEQQMGTPIVFLDRPGELADMLSPPVTVVAYDAVELGRRAAELLFARIDGATEPGRLVTVPTHVVKRGSGEICPEQPS